MHTKAAANKLLSKFGTLELEVSRIQYDDLPALKQYINECLDFLQDRHLITDYQPKYMLGSTRLISDVLGDKLQIQPYESQQLHENVLRIKKDFGDIDVDIKTLAPLSTIKDALESFKPQQLYGRLCGSSEVNTAIKLNDKIYQLDFVDVTNQASIEFRQFSGFLDMRHQLKGLVRELLSNAITKSTEIYNDDRELIIACICENHDYIYEQCKAKGDDVVLLDDIRWSLAHDRFKMVALFHKVKGLNILKTPYKINIDDIIPEDVREQADLITSYFYEDMEEIVNILKLPNRRTIYNSILMLRCIQRYPLSQRQKIWNNVNKNMKRKLPTSTAGGQLSIEEANHTLQYMKQYFPGVNYGDND